MPNWCTTHYRFHGKKEDLDTLTKIIDDATSKTSVMPELGQTWLGNILYAVGEDAATSNIPHNGKIASYKRVTNDTSDFVDVVTLDAWAHCPETWSFTLEKMQLISVKMTFYSLDEQNDEYVIYDPHGIKDFNATYCVSYVYSDKKGCFVGNNEETKIALCNIITHITRAQPKSETLEDLIDEVYNIDMGDNPDAYIWVIPVKHIEDPRYDPIFT